MTILAANVCPVRRRRRARARRHIQVLRQNKSAVRAMILVPRSRFVLIARQWSHGSCLRIPGRLGTIAVTSALGSTARMPGMRTICR